jgi:TIR domain
MATALRLYDSDERPLVFVSYSHKDEPWKDKLVEHLRNDELDDLLEIWEDRQIEPGADWYANIKQSHAAPVAAAIASVRRALRTTGSSISLPSTTTRPSDAVSNASMTFRA